MVKKEGGREDFLRVSFYKDLFVFSGCGGSSSLGVGSLELQYAAFSLKCLFLLHSMSSRGWAQ